jgi:hypothetical protein
MLVIFAVTFGVFGYFLIFVNPHKARGFLLCKLLILLLYTAYCNMHSVDLQSRLNVALSYFLGVILGALQLWLL